MIFTWYDGLDYSTNSINQMDLSTGAVSNVFSSGACGIMSHNGKLIAGRDLGGRLVVVDVATKVQAVLDAGDGFYEYLCFSSDDTAIITTKADSENTSKLYAFSVADGTSAQLTQHGGMHMYPECSPMGNGYSIAT